MQTKVISVHRSECGQRQNQEDFVLVNKELQLYIVCDGVGGSARGEVASQLTAETIRDYVQTHPFDGRTNLQEWLKKAVESAESALRTYLAAHPMSHGLGTTLTFVQFHQHGVTLAHIGDSRIYHHRRGQDLFVTEDHSLVQDLIKARWITPEQAKNHPRRNVITRAIQANRDKSVAPEVRLITDIQKQDLLLLCSDGVTESWDNAELFQLLDGTSDLNHCSEQIHHKCASLSKDNYSYVLLQIQDVVDVPNGISHFPTDVEVTFVSPAAAQPPMVMPLGVGDEHTIIGAERTDDNPPKPAPPIPPQSVAPMKLLIAESKLTQPFKFNKQRIMGLVLLLIFVGWLRQCSKSAFSDYTETVKGVSFEMKAIKGDTFSMGSNDGDNDEKPVHRVTVSNFHMGKFEVTQRLWKAVMSENPSSFKNCDECPVDSVSWNDVQEFLKKLNALTGKRYQLPTEAQWEYAARSGQTYQYAGSNHFDSVAWYDGNSDVQPHPVGHKQVNGYGLYDMSGNVSEWCADWHSKDYNGAISNNSSTASTENPTGAVIGLGRVLRGGSWKGSLQHVRVAHRSHGNPSNRYNFVGFRIARFSSAK